MIKNFREELLAHSLIRPSGGLTLTMLTMAEFVNGWILTQLELIYLTMRAMPNQLVQLMLCRLRFTPTRHVPDVLLVGAENGINDSLQHDPTGTSALPNLVG
jgi:hypothetical protein